MTLPTDRDLYQVIEHTWPPARQFSVGNWTIRDGAGGGKRVSSATAEGPVTAADIPAMAQAMRDLGQPPLVMIRDGEDALDAIMAEAGYAVIDPVTLYACPIDALTAHVPPRVATFAIWPPLAIMNEIWAAGGIGPSRLAVMERAEGTKTAILSRQSDRAAGVAYVGIHDGIAMIHALEVAPELRRQGAARNIMAAAAHWARDKGARVFSLVVTGTNAAGNGLYASLGMQVVGKYHYRILKDDPAA